MKSLCSRCVCMSSHTRQTTSTLSFLQKANSKKNSFLQINGSSPVYVLWQQHAVLTQERISTRAHASAKAPYCGLHLLGHIQQHSNNNPLALCTLLQYALQVLTGSETAANSALALFSSSWQASKSSGWGTTGSGTSPEAYTNRSH